MQLHVVSITLTMDWNGVVYRGWEEDGCKAVCRISTQASTPKYGRFGNSFAEDNLSGGSISKGGLIGILILLKVYGSLISDGILHRVAQRIRVRG